MKKLLCAGALALAFLLTPSTSQAADFCGFKVEGGLKLWLRVTPQGSWCYPSLPQGAPWYLYWPVDGNCQVPTSPTAPYLSPFGVSPPCCGSMAPHYWSGR